ncbi:flagellar motor protein PomA [Permianibacter sp. IMCC34836]|nr:flagellar motor protein PomA [Permianibacter fluminis]
MDWATVLGGLGAVAVLALSIWLGGDIAGYLDWPSVLIVLVGSPLVVLSRFRGRDCLQALRSVARVLRDDLPAPADLVAEIGRLAEQARKGGLLALESAVVDDAFAQKGVALMVDGHDGDAVRTSLQRDVSQQQARHLRSAQVFRSLGDVAPAMGMLGTLIGLVAMLAHLDDPKSVGPGMAVALLTTLYGALIAHLVALPLADKLQLIAQNEKRLRMLVMDGLAGIQAGNNPRLIVAQLQAYLDPERSE